MPSVVKKILFKQFSSVFIITVFGVFLFSLICAAITTGVILNPPDSNESKSFKAPNFESTKLAVLSDVIRIDQPYRPIITEKLIEELFSKSHSTTTTGKTTLSNVSNDTKPIIFHKITTSTTSTTSLSQKKIDLTETIIAITTTSATSISPTISAINATTTAPNTPTISAINATTTYPLTPTITTRIDTSSIMIVTATTTSSIESTSIVTILFSQHTYTSTKPQPIITQFLVETTPITLITSNTFRESTAVTTPILRTPTISNQTTTSTIMQPSITTSESTTTFTTSIKNEITSTFKTTRKTTARKITSQKKTRTRKTSTITTAKMQSQETTSSSPIRTTNIPTCSIGQTMFLNTSLNYNAINFSAFYTFEKKILLKTPALCCMQCLLDTTCYVYDYEISSQSCSLFNPVTGMVTATNDAQIAEVFYVKNPNHVTGYYY